MENDKKVIFNNNINCCDCHPVTKYEYAIDLAAFGYVFNNTTSSQSIAVGSNVLFNSNGPLKHIMHTPGTDSILINHAGIHNIAFSIYTWANNFQVWGVAVNGVVLSHFEADGRNITSSISLSLNANDIITIRNVDTIPNLALLRTGVISAYVLIYKNN